MDITSNFVLFFIFPLKGSKLQIEVMNIFELIVSTLISTGLITALVTHLYEKRLRTHEIKVGKYIILVEELAKLVGEEPNWDRLRVSLNEALLFASDNVVKQILNFNAKFTHAQKVAGGQNFQMSATDIQPLIIAIREDLYLKSKSIEKNGLIFFQKP